MFVSLRKLADVLDDFEIWIVALLVGGSFAYSKLLPVVVGAALIFWILRWLAKCVLTRRTPVDLGVILLGLMAILSLWISPIPEVTSLQVYRLFAGIAIYYALANWVVSGAGRRLAMLGLAAVGVGLALMAPISVTWYLSKLPFVPEVVYGRFVLLVTDSVHPNTMAGNLVLFFPVPAAWIIFSWKESGRVLKAGAILASLFMLAIIVLTKSRAAWLAVVVISVILVMLRWGKNRRFLVGAGAISAIILLTIKPLKLLELLAANDALGGFSGRAEIWSRAIAMINDHPFTGIGMGAFPEIADSFYSFMLFSPHQIVHAHNLFLQVAIDLGLPGLIAWLAIFFLIMATAWQVYRRGMEVGDRWWAGAGAAMISSQIALLSHGLTDAVTWGLIRITPLVWVLWGFTIALWFAQNTPGTAPVESWFRPTRSKLSGEPTIGN